MGTQIVPYRWTRQVIFIIYNLGTQSCTVLLHVVHVYSRPPVSFTVHLYLPGRFMCTPSSLLLITFVSSSPPLYLYCFLHLSLFYQVHMIPF